MLFLPLQHIQFITHYFDFKSKRFAGTRVDYKDKQKVC